MPLSSGALPLWVRLMVSATPAVPQSKRLKDGDGQGATECGRCEGGICLGLPSVGKAQADPNRKRFLMEGMRGNRDLCLERRSGWSADLGSSKPTSSSL